MMPNELIEAIARTHFSGYESRVFWFIVRKTWGWNENGKQKKSDWIALSQFSLGTDLYKPHVCRTISRLMDRNIIRKDKNNRLSIQTDHTLWKRHIAKRGSIVTKIGNTFTKNGNHKRNLIQKKHPTPPTRMVDKQG